MQRPQRHSLITARFILKVWLICATFKRQLKDRGQQMVIENRGLLFDECCPSNVDLSLATNEQGDGRLYRQWGCIARAVFITNNPDTPGTMATIPTHRGSGGTMPDLWPYTFYISKPGTKRIHKQFPAMSGHASISHFYFTGFTFLPQNDSIQKAALIQLHDVTPCCLPVLCF